MTKEIDISEIANYVKVLHCGIRWKIIEILQEGSKSSDEIFKILKESNPSADKNPEQCQGQCKQDSYENLKKHSLYYHLRELESVGIIELDTYKPSEENRAPEKVWKLNLDKLVINFIDII